jgi:hypothetical protein
MTRLPIWASLLLTAFVTAAPIVFRGEACVPGLESEPLLPSTQRVAVSRPSLILAWANANPGKESTANSRYATKWGTFSIIMPA